MSRKVKNVKKERKSNKVKNVKVTLTDFYNK